MTGEGPRAQLMQHFASKCTAFVIGMGARYKQQHDTLLHRNILLREGLRQERIVSQGVVGQRNVARVQADKNLNLPAWSSVLSRRGIRHIPKFRNGRNGARTSKWKNMCSLVARLETAGRVIWRDTNNGRKSFFNSHADLQQSHGLIDHWVL